MYEKVLSAKPDGSSVLFIDVGASCSRQLLLGYVLYRLQQQVAVTFVPSGERPEQLPGQPLLSCRPLDEQPGCWQSAAQLAAQLEAAVPAAGPPAQLMVLEDASCLAHWLGVGRLCRLVQRVMARGHQMVLAVGENARR
ncbi:uncharacterized protein LOC119110405 [Pollicipes pollicipes]|uniref:uncharacterized protein LOC119110405 n=1 Tax=Pollicipes pollicipes TaxID=41117 RepID=UPI0018859BC4|nr:uncharacterized protein LOC119110405 [Pollicipes pollicipes]XP_037090115.1 uncharacterized protein LOC119110405 [Pollicipes pollicipes]